MKLRGRRTRLCFCREIRSCADAAESLCVEVRAWLAANGLRGACFPVELLARECLSNAILHGNCKDADKPIVLRLWIGREWIHLQITDQGGGFAWREAFASRPDASAASGRGLHICALYSARARFNRRGNQITFWIGKPERRGKEDSRMDAYVIERQGEQGSVKMKGDLTAAMIPELQAALKEALGGGARELIFDLTNTAMLDSSGMGLLIATANSLAPRGGQGARGERLPGHLSAAAEHAVDDTAQCECNVTGEGRHGCGFQCG